MKSFIIYLLIGISTMVMQTTILKWSVFQGIFYDLLIPMVVFAQLYLSTRTAVTLVLILGFVMDLFSGGTFGLYLTLYCWILIGVKLVSNVFNVRGIGFRSILISICVLGQNLIHCFCSADFSSKIALFISHIGPVAWQVFFASITGPVVIQILHKIYMRIEALEQNDERKRQDLIMS